MDTTRVKINSAFQVKQMTDRTILLSTTIRLEDRLAQQLSPFGMVSRIARDRGPWGTNSGEEAACSVDPTRQGFRLDKHITIEAVSLVRKRI